MSAQIVAFPYKEKPFRYILQNEKPTPVHQRSHWLDWMSQHRDGLRRVDEKNGIFVLTEFVGLDQGAYSEPALWKTIVLTENKITPIHGLYWTFSEANDASWFHNYVVSCVAAYRGDDLEDLYDELVQLAGSNDYPVSNG